MSEGTKLTKLSEILKFEKCSLQCFHFPAICLSGDSSSIVSAICYTVPKSAMGSSLYALESGSDFKSRGLSPDSRVIFGPGVTVSTCDVMLIDDSEYEEEEEFEIVLADASDNARIGRVASAKVLISGPNDASTVSLGNTAFTVSEDAGNREHLWDSITHILIPFLNTLLLVSRMSLRHLRMPFLSDTIVGWRHIIIGIKTKNGR